MATHLDTPIELAVASLSDARLIEPLLDDYLCELSKHREVPVGATDSATYRFLHAYWSEPGRHVFIIKRSGDLVGFAFVRDPISTGSSIHQLAEFYIKPELRRFGVGRRAVIAIWERFPGEWELQVHARNSGAAQFWASCVELETGECPQVSELRAEDGRRLQLALAFPLGIYTGQ